MPAHRINRVEVELHSDDKACARMLSERVSRMHEHRIAPVLDHVCSELGATEALVRLDQLALDLGALATDTFEDDFVAKLEHALRAALTKALSRRAAGDQRALAALELLETFALTGGLPWWAPPEGGVVAHHFARAAVLAEAELVALVRRIASDPGALDRIARACDPDALVTLVERTQGGQPLPRGVDLDDRRMLLSVLARHSGGRDAAVRPAAGSAGSAGTARAAETATPRDQIDDERAVDAVIRDPRASTDRSHDAPLATDRRLPDARSSAPGDEAAPIRDASRPRQAAEQTSTDRQRLPALISSATSAPQPPLVPPVRSAADAFPLVPPPARTAVDVPPPLPVPPESTAARVAYLPTAPAAPAPASARHPLPASPARTDADVPHALAVPPARVAADVPHALPAPPARTAVTAARLPPESPAPTAAIRATRRSALARLDELYVGDAGLVILWPFLERFFARAGVLGEDRRFFDEAAQQRAVALLEVLATADLEPLEFRLPLAKLLSGRPLESDFLLERPLTPAQLAEADHLLAAVIDRAPIGDLSIPGFRAAFLARPGALGTRDGAWLLQVERRAHDVVLDRFPWSWSWVRLPWMPEPLRVEW